MLVVDIEFLTWLDSQLFSKQGENNVFQSPFWTFQSCVLVWTELCVLILQMCSIMLRYEKDVEWFGDFDRN